MKRLRDGTLGNEPRLYALFGQPLDGPFVERSENLSAKCGTFESDNPVGEVASSVE